MEMIDIFVLAVLIALGIASLVCFTCHLACISYEQSQKNQSDPISNIRQIQREARDEIDQICADFRRQQIEKMLNRSNGSSTMYRKRR